MNGDYSVHVHGSGTHTIGGSVVGGIGNFVQSGDAHQNLSIQQAVTSADLPRLFGVLSTMYQVANSATDLPVPLRDEVLDAVEQSVALLNARVPNIAAAGTLLAHTRVRVAPWTNYGSGLQLDQQMDSALTLMRGSAG